MNTFRSGLAKLLPALLRDRLAQIALLVVTCLLALLLGLPAHDGERSDSRAAVEERDQRAPSFAPVGLVWGICCASVFGLATLSVPVRRALTRHLRQKRR